MYLIKFLKIFGQEQFTTPLGNEFHTGTTLTKKKCISSIGFEFREDQLKGVAMSYSFSVQLKHHAA